MKNVYRPKSKIRSRIISIVIILALIISTIYFVFSNQSNVDSVALGTVDYQDFSRTFYINADLEPVHEQIIEVPAQSIIKSLYVKEGDQVKKNQKLLLLDTSVWEEEKVELEQELDELKITLEEQAELTDLFDQGDLLASANLQDSLLSALTSSFEMPDFSSLANLSLDQIFGNQINTQEMLTLIDRAIYLTEQVEKFVGQVRNMVDLLTGFEASPELAELLDILKQQLHFLHEIQTEIIDFILDLISTVSESDGFDQFIDLLEQILVFANENQAEIEALLDKIQDLLDGIDFNTQTIVPDSTKTATESTSESEQTESDLTETDDLTDNTDQQNDSTIVDTEETKPSETEIIEPEAFQNNMKFSKGISAKINLSSMLPRLLTNLGLLDFDQDIQSLLAQSGIEQGLNMTDQLEGRIAELDALIMQYSDPIKADFDGLIAELNVVEDQLIAQDASALTLYSENELIAVYYANKRDAGVLDVGQPVVYDYEDLKLSGEIIYKSPVAKDYSTSFSSDNMGGMDFSMLGSMSGTDNFLGSLNSVQVKMSVEGEDLDQVIIGFDIDCEIVVEEVNQVLSIPAEALFMEDELSYVYIVEDERLSKKNIETGLQSAEYIEVLSGLSEKDEVVLNPKTQYEDGQRVKIND